MNAPLRSDVVYWVTQRIDYTSTANIVYYGYAAAGSATSAAVWQIRRETQDSSGRPIQVDFPNGNPNTQFIWDQRANLSYS